MAAATYYWVVQLLRLVPGPVHRALDAWSYRLARKRADERRAASLPKSPQPPIDYRLKHWRD